MKDSSPTNLGHVGDKELVKLVHSTKKGIFKAIDHRETHAETFHVGVMVLEIMERELRHRGYDPSNEKVFGRDIIGEIIAERLKSQEEDVKK